MFSGRLKVQKIRVFFFSSDGFSIFLCGCRNSIKYANRTILKLSNFYVQHFYKTYRKTFRHLIQPLFHFRFWYLWTLFSWETKWEICQFLGKIPTKCCRKPKITKLINVLLNILLLWRCCFDCWFDWQFSCFLFNFSCTSFSPFIFFLFTFFICGG